MTILDELERLSKEATPGPWTCFDDTSDSDMVESWDFYILRQDAAFIDAARKHIDALIEVARAAQKAVNLYRSEEAKGSSGPMLAAIRVYEIEKALEKLK